MCIHCPNNSASRCELKINRKDPWPIKADELVTEGEKESFVVESSLPIQKRKVACEDGQDSDDTVPATKKICSMGGLEIPQDEEVYKDGGKMHTFNFKIANERFKAIDLLKRYLGSEPALKHFEVNDWHPPKPPPARKTYIPSAKLLPDTPIGDQKW